MRGGVKGGWEVMRSISRACGQKLYEGMGTRALRESRKMAGIALETGHGDGGLRWRMAEEVWASLSR